MESEIKRKLQEIRHEKPQIHGANDLFSRKHSTAPSPAKRRHSSLYPQARSLDPGGVEPVGAFLGAVGDAHQRERHERGANPTAP